MTKSASKCLFERKCVVGAGRTEADVFGDELHTVISGQRDEASVISRDSFITSDLESELKIPAVGVFGRKQGDGPALNFQHLGTLK